jgi:transposase
MADKQRILALIELGWSYRRIERETGVRRETVARYDPGRAAKAAKVPTGAAGKAAKVSTGPHSAAEVYRDTIEAAVAKGLTAQRIWQDLREAYGYGHAYSSVKRFVRKIKRTRRDVADVMEHPPGEEAQVDFFQGPPTLDPTSGRWRRPWIFRMALSCSRHSYEEPVWSQDRTTFLRAHEHAFHSFCGVPKVVRHDNLKAAVVRACLYDPDVSEVYAAFARHWGFVPLPSRPRHPQEQGIEERGGGYVKDNALKGRRFDSIEELDAYLKKWNRTIARLRIHGTTRKQVYTHFLEVEQPALGRLPEEGFHFFQAGTRTVHPDGHVQLEGAFYSVPHVLVGEQVRVHWDDRLVRVYAKGRSIAVHTRTAPGTFTTQKDHRPDHKPARQEAYEELLLARAEHTGPQTLAWARTAIRERGVRAYRLLQGMAALTKTYPREQIDWACGIALEQQVFRYQPLLRLVEEGASLSPAPQLLQQHPLLRNLSDYTREVQS